MKKAFTLIELLVVIAIIAVLMAILMPTLHRAREQGKRIVCESNLKQMSLAWIMYAQENDGKIMKGTPGATPGNCWGDAGSNTGGTEQTRQAALMTGALWPYCKSLKLYKCPTGRRGEVLTYSIPDSMNGTKQDTPSSNRNGRTILFITRLDQMRSPPPWQRPCLRKQAACDKGSR